MLNITTEVRARWMRLVMQLLYDVNKQPADYREEFTALEDEFDALLQGINDEKRFEEQLSDVKLCDAEEIENGVAMLRSKFNGTKKK